LRLGRSLQQALHQRMLDAALGGNEVEMFQQLGAVADQAQARAPNARVARSSPPPAPFAIRWPCRTC
jgi:hypothetical protein